MGNVKKTNDFNEIVLGRRSVKMYDTNVKITREELSEILEKASRAPSSVNMQPWRFLVIDTEEGKAKLAALAPYNKSQVETSAAVIAVFIDLQNVDYMNEITARSVELGYMPHEVGEMMLNKFKPQLDSLSKSELSSINLIDAGLASMQLMLVARSYGYDTNPMGGYEKSKIAGTFGLDEERYQPVMLISIGKAAAEGHPTYRLPLATTTVWA
ncbi:nitroreductase family protein [Paenibacillus rigui]|uniref:Nitroreductase family protein n=1 Tax=Paenibacillus rigui TaxID=554312 RepID=A0A229UH21_9BACL|nr:nitroreductase family protein [Paenibacillus rigui]OXM82684.1 nitroreductase family protein [Paenibacillus rigui]